MIISSALAVPETSHVKPKARQKRTVAKADFKVRTNIVSPGWQKRTLLRSPLGSHTDGSSASRARQRGRDFASRVGLAPVCTEAERRRARADRIGGGERGPRA